ncbi:MAG: hypothetical protein IVW54_13355 [Candidatus Binataceae bacterium]|nr:hypothetical protein [Candidatus Binataceae bacterium]
MAGAVLPLHASSVEFCRANVLRMLIEAQWPVGKVAVRLLTREGSQGGGAYRGSQEWAVDGRNLWELVNEIADFIVGHGDVEASVVMRSAEAAITT